MSKPQKNVGFSRLRDKVPGKKREKNKNEKSMNTDSTSQ